MESTSPFSTERLAAMRAQYAPTSFDKETLLHDRYLLAAEGRYRVYYAGLGAQPSPTARAIFVGLTPGFSQMQEAARAFTETPAHVRNDPVAYSNILRHRVAFAGTMRRNLCSMLDALGFPEAFGIAESAQLFDEDRDDVSATSALVLPVFVAPDLHNFRGAGVDLAEVPLFRRMIEELLAPRLERSQKALIVPLGVAAATGVRHLCEIGRVAYERVLAGMPHPSGSNGHRIPQFNANEASMRERIAQWFN